MSEIENLIRNTLEKNQREIDGHFFTVPAVIRYPFQWLWDSCFHATIYNRLGASALAQQELLSACAKQHDSGLLPHINFWHDKNTTLPAWGRELTGDTINHIFKDDSSGITQPPLIARVALDTFKVTGDTEFLSTIYPKLARFFLYLATERSTGGSSLLFIINPDESGEDNSPRYDTRLQLPAQHSALFHFEKRTELMDKLVACEYETKICMRQHFAVIDVGFNAIYLDGLQALSEMAQSLGQPAEAEAFLTRAEKVKADMQRMLTTDGVHYYSLDAETNELLSVATWNVFMPLYAGLVTKEQAAMLVEELQNPDTFWSEHGIRTTSKQEPSYDADDGFWRGPIWHAPHWFIIQGLKRYGYKEVAATIKTMTEGHLTSAGMREHYDPRTGAGGGAEGFTWGGLVLDM